MWAGESLGSVQTMSSFTSHRIAKHTGISLSLGLLLVLSGCAPEPAPPRPEATPSESEVAELPKATGDDPAPAPKPAPEPSPENPGFNQAELDELLRQAAWANDLETTERLIGWGADVNAQDGTQQSAYLISTSEGRLDLLRITLEHGADVQALDSWNGTGLIRAAERGHWDVVGELIQAGVPLDHVNRVGYQAIHEDVWMGRDDATYHATTRVLFAGGADFNTPSVSEGLTPLQMAEYRGFGGQTALIRDLLNAPVPADPTAALLAAAESGDPTMAAAALRAGADASVVGAAGKTPYELADAGGHVVTLQLLSALGHGNTD